MGGRDSTNLIGDGELAGFGTLGSGHGLDERIGVFLASLVEGFEILLKHTGQGPVLDCAVWQEIERCQLGHVGVVVGILLGVLQGVLVGIVAVVDGGIRVGVVVGIGLGLVDLDLDKLLDRLRGGRPGGLGFLGGRLFGLLG